MKTTFQGVPYVIERDPNGGERSFDLYSRLLKDRIIFLNGPVMDEVAGILIAQFLFLESQDKDKEIWFYINSPGGSVTAGFAIYDAMSYIKAPINTVCMGQAASMGAFLLCMGDKDRRHATPNSRIMLHMVSSGSQGQILDMKTQYEEAVRLNEMIFEKLACRMELTSEEVKKMCERDLFMGAEEAKKLKVIDSVIESGKSL